MSGPQTSARAPKPDRSRSIFDESLRAFLRPIAAYLDDPGVTEVLVNGPDEVWIERGGRLRRTDARFTEDGLHAAAVNVAQFVGRPLSEERPRLDARLPDGSRVHVVLPPMSRKGIALAIRKFFPATIDMGRYVEFGSITPDGARLLETIVATGLNVVVAGGTGSGKTTLLNILGRSIPEAERIVTIEDSAELRLVQPHVLPLESRPADRAGKGAVTIGDLLHSSLRLRPDRIVIGEVRGPEAFDLVQAMNTGHGGALCTTHANTPTETLRRVESLCLMHEAQVPMVAVRALLTAALDVVVCCARLADGARRVTHVAEVLPLDERGEYRTRDLYVWRATGREPDDAGGERVLGEFRFTGVVPRFLPRLHAAGFEDVDEAFFAERASSPPEPESFGDSTDPGGAAGAG